MSCLSNRVKILTHRMVRSLPAVHNTWRTWTDERPGVRTQHHISWSAKSLTLSWRCTWTLWHGRLSATKHRIYSILPSYSSTVYIYLHVDAHRKVLVAFAPGQHLQLFQRFTAEIWSTVITTKTLYSASSYYLVCIGDQPQMLASTKSAITVHCCTSSLLNGNHYVSCRCQESTKIISAICCIAKTLLFLQSYPALRL